MNLKNVDYLDDTYTCEYLVGEQEQVVYLFSVNGVARSYLKETFIEEISYLLEDSLGYYKEIRQ